MLRGSFRRLFRPPPMAAKFISYPKTGNTWVRLLLGRYFQLLWSLDELLLLEETEREKAIFAVHGVPTVDLSHGVLEWMTQTASDLTYDQVVRPYVNIPVIVLTRHPLDTLLSKYMQVKYRSGHEGKDHIVTFADLVDEPVMGLDKFIRFHNLWVGKRRLCIARYEDLRADTEKECVRVLEFIGGPVDRGVLRQAIDYASFDNMKAMERDNRAPCYKTSGYDIFATGDRNNPNAYHVREGRIGGYREHLTPGECAAFLERIARELSPVYGYREAAGAAVTDKIPVA